VALRSGTGAHLTPLSSEGEVTHILHHVEDVTEVVRLRRQGFEQKQVEATLRTSSEWFSTTLNSIGDAVIATDFSGRIVSILPSPSKRTRFF